MPRRRPQYYLDYGPLLPTSGPDWRWERALEIVSSKKNASVQRDGPDIVRCIRFIRRTFKGVMGTEMKRLLRDDPSLVMAFRIFNEGARRRLELQCRVLARQSPGVIAIEMGLTKAIVATYCLMFFDVALRLKATSYILHRVIGLPLQGPPTPEMLMMLCAYYNGPLLIEPWLDFLDHQCEAHDLSTEHGRMRESIEVLIAAHSLPFDATTHRSLARLSGPICGLRKKMFLRRSASQVIAENVSQMLGEMRWKRPEGTGVHSKSVPQRPVLMTVSKEKSQIA